MKISCPACGAEVYFKSKTSIFCVCSFCNSTLVRHDLNIETLGEMTEMPQDMSPLQLGTKGIFERLPFEVVGRQRIAWKSGVWNEWYLHFENDKEGWLADAQGFYMVSFQFFESLNLPDLSNLQVSSHVIIRGDSFTVDDIREVTCIGSEGELPVKSIKGRKSMSVDLVGKENTFCNIDYSQEGNRLFLGKYVDFENLNFKNLRNIDGW